MIHGSTNSKANNFKIKRINNQLKPNTFLTSKPVTSPISEPVIAPVSASKPNLKTSIPYPLRRNDERNREKANNQIEKFYQIFKDMILLKKLLEKLGDPGKFLILCDFLELADHLISRPVRVVYLSTLRRSFLKTEKALINVFEGELTLRVGKEAITFNLDQTSRYSVNYSGMRAKRIDVIDMAYEEYSLEVLGFFDTISSDNPTLYFHDLLAVELKDLPPHLEYAFLKGDDKLPVIIAKDLSVEEKTALIMVLKSHKQAIAWKLSDIKGINPKFCTHKILIEEDFEPAVQHQRRVNPKIHDVIKLEVIKLLEVRLIDPISDSPWVSLVHCVPKKGGFTVVENEDNELIPTRLVTKRMLKRCEDTNLYLNYEKSHFMVKEGIVLSHKISKQGIEVDKAKVDIITKLPHPRTVKGIRSFLGHAKFYERFIKDCSKIARPMTRLLEKDTSFHFSQKCVEAFQILKRKLTEAPILIAPDWDMPFELMCDASDFAIGAFPGKRQDKHFRPIHYASKTMIEAESNYTTTKKEMLAVVFKGKIALMGFTPPGIYLQAGDHRKVQVNELNELRDQAYENSLVYKEKTKRLHDSKIKNRVFNIGDRVLLFNSCLKIFSGKLKSHWSGPFTISQVYPYGIVKLSQSNGPNFKVNGHRVKHYFGKDIPKVVVLDL
uniref:Reverse transcriptase/retrotransposon-derived protein RNase H-like domain-containing protein n=1 Tax=Tanacetum cinerariifolium TaxID=118510 RepID=A0A699H020_TANCI|nr:hypothetical protein [Tanacetum cinerariifolium]